MPMSDYLEKSIINHVFKGISWSSPSCVYLALFEGTVSDTGIASAKELSGGTYSRKLCTTFGISAFAGQIAPNGRLTETYPYAYNADDISFDSVTGSGWQPVNSFALMNWSTSGCVLFYGSLQTPVTVLTGEQFYIPNGRLIISLNGSVNNYSNIPTSGYSSYLCTKLYNHILNKTTYTSPGLGIYLALYETHPSVGDKGGVEVHYTDYKRQNITWTSADDTSGSVGNSASVVFSASSAGWGNIVGIGIQIIEKSSTLPTLLFYCPITNDTRRSSLTLGYGDGYKINTKNFKLYVT